MTRGGKARGEGAKGSGLKSSPIHLLHRALQLALDLHGEASLGAGGPSAITQRQHTVLAAAAIADGQTQNDLVRATGIDRSTLADLVARMLAKGLLERQRSSTDARANTVRLSDAGRAVLADSAAAAAAADARLLAHLPGKKREGFVKSLAALAAAADGAAADAEPRPKKVKPPKPPKAPKVKPPKAKSRKNRPDAPAAPKPPKKKKRRKAV